MCHRRGEWSRTSSTVREPEDEAADDREWWGVRAKERLASFSLFEAATDATDETRERPAVEAEATELEPTESDGGEEPEEEDELEEEPILADD